MGLLLDVSNAFDAMQAIVLSLLWARLASLAKRSTADGQEVPPAINANMVDTLGPFCGDDFKIDNPSSHRSGGPSRLLHQVSSYLLPLKRSLANPHFLPLTFLAIFCLVFMLCGFAIPDISLMTAAIA